MNNETKASQEKPRQGHLKKLWSFLTFREAPYFSLLFVTSGACMLWLLFQIVVLYVPWGNFLPRMIAAIAVLAIFYLVGIYIFASAVHAVVKTLVKPAWLQGILTIAGIALFCPVGVAFCGWSLYKQRKWLPCALMAAVGLLSCILILFRVLNISCYLSVTLLPFILAGVFAITAFFRPSPGGAVTRGRIVWAFLPVALTGILWSCCLWQAHGIRSDSAKIRTRLAERLEHPMDVGATRARLASGLSPTEEPLKSLFADCTEISETLQSLKRNENRAEVQAFLLKFQEDHGDFVKAAEAWKMLPAQNVQHDVPENDYFYAVLLPELAGFRNTALYFAMKMRANADDRECVADCNHAMISAREWALENPLLINTIVAVAIEAIRLDALCQCLEAVDYSEEEWRALVGEVPDWNVLLARAIAEESVFHENAMLCLLKTPQKTADDLKKEFGLPSFNSYPFLCRWFEMDYHCGLKYTEKAVEHILNDSRDGLTALADEFEKRIRQRGALVSGMLLPDVAKSLLKCRQIKDIHSLSLLARRVMDYRRSHDNTLPETLDEVPLEESMASWAKTSVAYEKGDLEIKTLYDDDTVKIRGFRLYCPEVDEKNTTGRAARCAVTVSLEKY